MTINATANNPHTTPTTITIVESRDSGSCGTLFMAIVGVSVVFSGRWVLVLKT